MISSMIQSADSETVLSNIRGRPADNDPDSYRRQNMITLNIERSTYLAAGHVATVTGEIRAILVAAAYEIEPTKKALARAKSMPKLPLYAWA